MFGGVGPLLNLYETFEEEAAHRVVRLFRCLSHLNSERSETKNERTAIVSDNFSYVVMALTSPEGETDSSTAKVKYIISENAMKSFLGFFP